MPTSLCEDLGIPNRLRRNGQSVVDRFDNSNECLYRWFNPNIDYTDGVNSSSSVIGRVFSPFYDLSCNRESLCEKSTDVLYNTKNLPHRFNFGVIETTVGSIQGFSFEYDLQSGSTIERVSVKLGVKHKPEECMYPHSEIIIRKNDSEVKEELKPPSLRTVTRTALSKLFIVCHNPDENFNPIEKE